MSNILLKAKVQSIYFQTNGDSLGISYATSEKRITIIEAEEILKEREIDFKEVLKVKYEFIEIDLPLNELENNIIK